MCGIAGIVAPEGFAPETLVAMTQMIAYRGPSAFGFAYASPGTKAPITVRHNDEMRGLTLRPAIGLGNRRLAILDLSASGNQPFLSQDGSICATYNGEIYNYREVRNELQTLGHAFRTQTDTEVLVHAYQQWGESCLHRFNGMWSFAIWDRNRQTLFCARDRLGVKPFYYVQTGEGFYFGSEIKQVLFASGIQRKANPRVLLEFLEWGLQDHDEETSFEGVKQLLGGHSLTLSLRSALAPTISCYWQLKNERAPKESGDDAVHSFKEHFRDAVQLRLRSDVPVGVSLSGGLDSSAILCQAKLLQPAHTFAAFSACFEEPQIDERSFMSAAAGATASQTHWTFPNSFGFWDSAETIAYHQDEPIGGTSVFAQWSIMREASAQRVPVLLGGQGGDETLCGYGKYYFFHLWHLLRRADPSIIREAFLFATNGARHRWSTAAVARYLPSPLRRPVSAATRLVPAERLEALAQSRPALGAADDIESRQIIDLTGTSLPKLLRHEDRNSMAHSVETRMPFLDYRLVEFAVRCPASLKLRDGWTKWLLREAMTGILPESIRLRKSKLGFNTPEADWLRTGLVNGHGSLCHSDEVRLSSLLEPGSLQKECSSFLNGEAGAMPAESLFRAVSIELWARVHRVS